MSRRVPWSSRLREDQGSATAETAIVLPVVAVMVAVLLVTAMGLAAQVRLEGAARAAARELARGEQTSVAVEAARRAGGADLRVEANADGEWAQVRVSRTVQAPSGILGGATWTLTAEASARREPQLIDRAMTIDSPIAIGGAAT